MRTTITLEPDIAARLKEFAHRRRLTFKAAVDAVMRRGLAAQERAEARPEPFVVEPHAGGFRPGLDITRLNQVVDQLEAEDFVRREAGPR